MLGCQPDWAGGAASLTAFNPPGSQPGWPSQPSWLTSKHSLQPHQIDQKLAPKVNHAAPGVFHVARSGLLQNALVNVVRDLVAEIFLHFVLNLFFIEYFDVRRINSISPQKLAMALIKLPERSVRPLAIDSERRREF